MENVLCCELLSLVEALQYFLFLCFKIITEFLCSLTGNI